MTETTKNDLINEVVAEMSLYIGKEEQDKLKVILLVKFKDYELVASEKLPSVIVKDNDWAIKRFVIDQVAAGLEESTIKQYVYLVNKFFRETGLNYFTTTGQDITDYLALRQYRDHISQSYKATTLRYLTQFFSWAYRKHHIDVDIMRDVDTIKAPRKKKERLTDEEVARCRVVVRDDLRASALLELMLSTGMRVGEISGLKIEDLNFREYEVRIWGEKSNRERIGFMNPDCKVALQQYIAGRTSGFVFVGKRNRLGLCKGSLEKIAKEIAEKAGGHVTATVHVYRKTFASVTYRKTNDVLLVSKLLGHADTETTIKYYLVDDIEDLKYRMKRAA